MTFYAVEIDLCPAYGWVGGPTVDVLIRSLRNRHERRNKRGDLALHTYTLEYKNVTDAEYLFFIKSAFMAVGGPTHSFLAKDHADYTHDMSIDDPAMPFAVCDGVRSSYQLSKTYTFGSAEFERIITKPVAGHTIYRDGVNVGDTADPLTGIVDLASPIPAPGVVLSWKGEFRVPVRFADMYLPATIDDKRPDGFAMNGSCTLQEVVGE